MPNISVKDVPEPWADALRQRAARNHRSLQGELMAIIERAVLEQTTGAGALSGATRNEHAAMSGDHRSIVVGLDRFGHPIVRRGWKTVEQVAAELRAKYPEPFVDGPLGVDIIRRDRDSR